MEIVTVCSILLCRMWSRRRLMPFLLALLHPVPALTADITLEQAWVQAEQANPALRAAQANLVAVQGELADASAPLWNNPQLGAEWSKGILPQTGAPDQINRGQMAWLAQTFEIAGQQGKRRGAAEQSLAATQEAIAEARRRLRAEVESRFVHVLGLQLRIQMEERTLNLVREAAAAVGKRVAAGEDSRLDGNLAQVEAERAQNQVSLLREQLVQARAELAVLLQWPADSFPNVDGPIDLPPASYGLEDLLISTANRPLLRAFDHREKSARSRLDLERAKVYPDVTLSLGAGNGTPDNAGLKVTTFSVSLPLPLFRRNHAGIGRAMADLTQAQVQKQAAQRDTRAQVIALWERFAQLRARVRALEESVLPALEENQRLSAVSFRAGEIGLLQLLLVNRQTLDGQLDLLDARIALRLTQVEMEAAAGWQPEPR